jgi:glutathione S-transferase
MTIKLYWMDVSHPSQAARKMLDLKGVDYEVVDVLPLSQRLHLRLAGFRRGTVPALKVDGRRIQGSRQIALAVDQLWPQPPLFPSDPASRARMEEAERWGEQQLQPVPRRLARYGAGRDVALRRWAIEGQSLPAAELLARISGPLVRYYGRTFEVDGRRAEEAGVRADLTALPELLAHVDALLADATIVTDPPNAAALQILSSVRLLDSFADLHELVSTYDCAEQARLVFPGYGRPLPPFLPAHLLSAIAPLR